MSLSINHSKQSLSSDLKLRCYTCLSFDRNLKPLNAEEKFLLAMLCPEMFFKAKHYAQYLICWECEFMIKNIKRFQARIMKAHLRIKQTLQGVKTIIVGLSTLKITTVETIDIPSQAPQIIPINLNQPVLNEIPHSNPTISTPLKIEVETIKIEVEEEEQCPSSDYGELIQSTKIQPASSDESTDTASETDMYAGYDPLVTLKHKKPKIIMKSAEMAVPSQTAIIAPDVKFNTHISQNVFINVPKDNIALRGYKEAVKVTGGLPNSVTGEEDEPTLVERKGSVPILYKSNKSVSVVVKDKTLAMKGKKSVPNLVKGKRRAPTISKREELFLKTQIGPNNPYLQEGLPPQGPGWDQKLGIYGYEEDEVKCVILNRSELNTYRETKRSIHGYKGTRYRCDKCVEKFKCQKNLDEHNKKHDKSRGSSVCEVCEQRFPNKSVRNEHYKLHFIVYECLQCQYQNNDRLKISEHIRRNHEVSVFDCKKCDAVFRTYKEKRKHRVTVHSKTHTCEECNKTFPSLNLMKTHMNIHQRDTTECPVCKKKVRKNYLDKHMKTHDNNQEDNAYCVDCGKTFKSRKCYAIHLKTSLKHNTIEKIGIKCDHCNKYFSTKTALKDHLEEVNGVKYTCDICKKESKNKVLLARHILFMHKGQKPQLKPKICEYCGKSFTVKKTLEQHINSHLGYRPLVCKDCGATFTYSAALFTHRRLVHKVKRRYEMTC